MTTSSPSLAISCSALRTAAFSSSVVASFLAWARASLSGSWSAIDFCDEFHGGGKGPAAAVFVLQPPGQPAADFLDPRVGGDLRRLGRQLIDEVPRLVDVVVLDELLQAMQGHGPPCRPARAGRTIDGNDRPDHDDERGKDGQRQSDPPPRGAVDRLKPLAVAFFHALAAFRLPARLHDAGGAAPRRACGR